MHVINFKRAPIVISISQLLNELLTIYINVFQILNALNAKNMSFNLLMYGQ